MDHLRSNSKKAVVATLAGISGLMVVGMLWARSAPPTLPMPKQEPVAQAPEPTPPPRAAEAPAAKDPASATASADTDSLKAALLGLNKKAEPAPQAQAPAPAARPRRAKVRAEAEADRGNDDQTMASAVEPALSFGLSDDQFHATIERWRGMKSCLGTHKTRADEASGGALRVSLKISCEGEVMESKVHDESNELAKAVAKCVQKQAMQLHFPRFQGEESVVKEAKFVF